MTWLIWPFRDAPEATGDEPEDTDFDMPKIYEPVSNSETSGEGTFMWEKVFLYKCPQLGGVFTY